MLPARERRPSRSSTSVFFFFFSFVVLRAHTGKSGRPSGFTRARTDACYIYYYNIIFYH